MITFKEFLIESRYAPLYHGTRIEKLEQILNTNLMIAGNDYGRAHQFSANGRQISLTRSLQFAKDWSSSRPQVAIEFNTQKLRNRYKVQPFNFFGTSATAKKPYARVNAPSEPNEKDFYNQKEEIVTRDIKDVEDYISRIWIWGLGNFFAEVWEKYPLIAEHPLLYDGDKKKWVNK